MPHDARHSYGVYQCAENGAERLEAAQEFGDGAVTVESSGAAGSTVYFLGDRPLAGGNKIGQLRGPPRPG